MNEVEFQKLLTTEAKKFDAEKRREQANERNTDSLLNRNGTGDIGRT